MKSKASLKTRTTQGLIWGGFSNGLQQLLNLFFGIWLSRILNVEDYGVIGILTIFTLLATTLQESGFTQAIANKEEPTHKDYNAVFWCSSLIGIVLYLILFVAAPFIASFFQIAELTDLARILFLGFVISSFGTAHNAYLFKNLMVKQRAVAMLTGLLVSGSIGVLLAYQGFAYWGLALQHLSYVLCTNSLFWFFSKWRPTFDFSFAPIQQMLPFSSRILATKLCLHLNNHIFNLLIGKFYSRTEVGYYSQSNKWNLMGSSVITEMVQGVAQPVFSSVVDDPLRQVRILNKLLSFAACIAFPALLGLAYIAPEFITIALTSKWAPSAYLLQILCVGATVIPLTNLFGNLLISRGKSSTFMWSTISFGIIQLILALTLYPWGVRIMVIASVSLQIIWLIVWFYLVKQEIAIKWKSLIKNILPYLLYTLTSLFIASIILQGINNLYLLFIAKLTVVAALYLTLLASFKDPVLKEFISYFKSIRLKSG